MRHRQVALFLVAVLGRLLLSSAALQPAQASTGSCKGAYTYLFDGRDYTGGSGNESWGALSSIEYRPQPLCSISGGALGSTWAMLAGGSATQYSQIGYIRQNCGGCTGDRFFWEYNPGAGSFTRGVWGAPVTGVSREFRSIYSSANHRAENKLDGLNGPDNADGAHSYTGWDPADWWYSQVYWNAEFYSEAHQPESDYSGTVSDKADFTSVQIKSKTDNQWYSYDFTDPEWELLKDWCWARNQKQNTSTWFQTWTDPDFIGTSNGCTRTGNEEGTP